MNKVVKLYLGLIKNPDQKREISWSGLKVLSKAPLLEGFDHIEPIGSGLDITLAPA